PRHRQADQYPLLPAGQTVTVSREISLPNAREEELMRRLQQWISNTLVITATALLSTCLPGLAAESGPELYLQTGHSGGIIAVVWSPDGRYLLTGARDKTAIIWDAASGQQLRTLEGHSPFAVAWSPDSKRVLTGSEDKTAIVWDAASGRKLCTLKG